MTIVNKFFDQKFDFSLCIQTLNKTRCFPTDSVTRTACIGAAKQLLHGKSDFCTNSRQGEINYTVKIDSYYTSLLTKEEDLLLVSTVD